MQEIKVFAGNASKQLGQEVVKLLGLPLGDMDVLRFADGEISVSINESVRGADVFIVQSTCNPVNDNLMELLVAIDAFKRASAGRITAVMPYFGYARQDRKSKARDPISAKLVADILTAAGADRVLTMDLHAAQIQGFFNIPVDHLLGVPLLAPYFGKLLTDGTADDSLVAVSPDLGSVTRARGFASHIEASLAIVDKRRPKANVSEVMNIIGDIHGKTCILVDDMVDTAGTLCQAADALKRFGASKVYACATHGVLSGPALERIEASCLEELVLLDTIPLPESKKSPKIRMLSVVPIFSEAISRINRGASVSTLFN